MHAQSGSRELASLRRKKIPRQPEKTVITDVLHGGETEFGKDDQARTSRSQNLTHF